MYDPKTNTTKLVRTCFNTHHVVLAEDADNTIWVSAGGPQQGAIGWVNRRILEETGDEAKAQGWAPVVIDTNGNGKLDDYVQPNQAVDPTKDKRLNAGLYGVGVNPSDGTVWGAVLGYPGYVLRFDPKTKLSEIYEPPFPGFGPRGFDIDRNGIAYVPLSSGHLGAFDRRKCKGPLNGPQAAEGKLCPEGWTLTAFPGPQFRDIAENGSAEASYYTWVDQQNTVRPRQQRPARNRQRQRVADGAGGRQVGQHAGSLSARLLRQVDRWPHRRSECRLEGPRAVDDRRQPDAVPSRNRQGNPAEDQQVPGPS